MLRKEEYDYIRKDSKNAKEKRSWAIFHFFLKTADKALSEVTEDRSGLPPFDRRSLKIGGRN